MTARTYGSADSITNGRRNTSPQPYGSYCVTRCSWIHFDDAANYLYSSNRKLLYQVQIFATMPQQTQNKGSSVKKRTRHG
jgi:hypothetical protein